MFLLAERDLTVMLVTVCPQLVVRRFYWKGEKIAKRNVKNALNLSIESLNWQRRFDLNALLGIKAASRLKQKKDALFSQVMLGMNGGGAAARMESS